MHEPKRSIVSGRSLRDEDRSVKLTQPPELSWRLLYAVLCKGCGSVASRSAVGEVNSLFPALFQRNGTEANGTRIITWR
jgi:hypothetical protein